MFLNGDQFFWNYAIFLLKLWHTIKQIWSIKLQCGHTIDIVWYVIIGAWSFIVQQWGDPELNGPNKVLFHSNKHDNSL